MKAIRSVLIDANITIRFLLQDHQGLFIRAKQLFHRAERGEIDCYFDEVTLAEVIWVLTSVYKMKREDIVGKLETLFVQEWVVNIRKHTMLRALAFYRMSTLNYIDCWLMSVSEEKHIPLETFDAKLKKHTI
ncbi:PIN domain-containing protein [Candidatus Gottesmanbacteria bacterium]|nr:PIN domain-containing protein [Candidatus Gottesmanbacteria bacterium]